MAPWRSTSQPRDRGHGTEAVFDHALSGAARTPPRSGDLLLGREAAHAGRRLRDEAQGALDELLSSHPGHRMSRQWT